MSKVLLAFLLLLAGSALGTTLAPTRIPMILVTAPPPTPTILPGTDTGPLPSYPVSLPPTPVPGDIRPLPTGVANVGTYSCGGFCSVGHNPCRTDADCVVQADQYVDCNDPDGDGVGVCADRQDLCYTTVNGGKCSPAPDHCIGGAATTPTPNPNLY